MARPDRETSWPRPGRMVRWLVQLRDVGKSLVWGRNVVPQSLPARSRWRPKHRPMHFDQIVAAFRRSATFQRLVLAFAVGFIVSCAASASDPAAAHDASAIEAGY